MKQAITLLVLILSINLLGQEVIWEENFEEYPRFTGVSHNGNEGDYPNAVSKWTIDATNAQLTALGDYGYVENISATHSLITAGNQKYFEIADTDGDLIWTSEKIDISDHENINLKILAIESPSDIEEGDYLDIYYAINNGSFSRVPNWMGYGDSNHTFIGNTIGNVTNATTNDADFEVQLVTLNTGLEGDTIQIRVIMNTNSGTDRLGFDNVIVSGTAITLSINDEVSLNKQLKLSYNTTNRKLNFTSPVKIASYSVYDVLGRKVDERFIKNNRLYLVKMNFENYMQLTRKFIVTQ